jgi:tRNA uridine 5-carbamoylmethylation protein Kti12
MSSTSDWIISTDNIIEHLAATHGFTYNEIFKETIRFAEMVMNKHLLCARLCDADIYIDRTNMTVKSRKQYIDKLRDYGYEFECVVFPVPDTDEWSRRLNSRPGKNIPQEAIDRMVNSYQEPTLEEGFKKITFI